MNHYNVLDPDGVVHDVLAPDADTLEEMKVVAKAQGKRGYRAERTANVPTCFQCLCR